MRECAYCVSPYKLSNGKHKGKTLDQVPSSYLEWLSITTSMTILIQEYRWHKEGHRPEKIPDHVLARILHGDN